MVTGRLKYNYDNGRYGLIVSGDWEKQGFHCGDTMEVLIDGDWIKTRIEMNFNQKWYLVGTPFSGNLDNIAARI